jgi:diadenosine tetraphosphate (Ap4A) HIT family hydrolase
LSEITEPGGCAMCDLEECEEATVVFRDELWMAQIVPGYDVPGWFVLRARRHAERLTGLDDAEAGTFGRRARDLTAAVTEVTGAPATYLLVFGENHAHFHALVTARAADVPEDRRGGDILKLRARYADAGAARSLVPGVRRAYRRLAGSDVLPAG